MYVARGGAWNCVPPTNGLCTPRLAALYAFAPAERCPQKGSHAARHKKAPSHRETALAKADRNERISYARTSPPRICLRHHQPITLSAKKAVGKTCIKNPYPGSLFFQNLHRQPHCVKGVCRACARKKKNPSGREMTARACRPEHFHFENALLTRKRQPPQRGVHSGENRVFRLNATFDFHKKSKVISSRVFCD